MVDAQAVKKRKASDEHSDEIVAVPGPPKPTAKKPRTEPVANGTTKAATAKGKAKVEPPKGRRTNGTLPEVEDDENGDVVELQEDEPPDIPQPAPRVARGGSKQPKAKNGTHPPPPRPSRAEEKLSREVESWRKQLEQTREFSKEISGQRDKLAKQLEEVFRVRNTDAEEILNDYKAQFSESMQRKDTLVQELTAQLSKLQSSSKSDKSYTLHFLTREAAEEEKQALREENHRLKEVIKQRDATIVGKEKQIHSLEEDVKATRRELDAEIERSKALLAKAPPPAVARHHVAPSDIRNAPVIKLYEDLTNILVTTVKIDQNPEFTHIDEEILACIYTYRTETKEFSLYFTLRNVYERPPDKPLPPRPTKEDLLHKVKYEPRDLGMVQPEIADNLSFFKEPFMFAHDQMTVFLKTLTDTLSTILEPEGEIEEESRESPEIEVVDMTGQRLR
ncbi:hypothetical protein BD413DRAFT_1576 [Trametes elegans]|nr:hypothetical protein BD413DRAFT_1576 [Trametes elegans]